MVMDIKGFLTPCQSIAALDLMWNDGIISLNDRLIFFYGYVISEQISHIW